MTRQIPSGRETHRPRHLAHPSPQLVIDEIGQPAEKQSDRRIKRGHVGQLPKIEFMLIRRIPEAANRPHRAAVKRHASVPDGQNLPGFPPKSRTAVKQGIAETAAGNDPDRHVKNHVFNRRLVKVQPIFFHISQQPCPGQNDPGQIGHRIPAHGKTAD